MDFTDVFRTSVEKIAKLLTTRYGYRFSLCNVMFYENSFFSDVYIPAHRPTASTWTICVALR